MDEDGAAVIHQAERIIYQASWRFQEECALKSPARAFGTGKTHRG